MQQFPIQGQLASDDGAAEHRGYATKKCSHPNEQVSTEGMIDASAGTLRVQDSVTESEDGVGSSNWSRRSGSKPTTTSTVSPLTSTTVGVSWLSYCSTMMRRASTLTLTSISSKATSLASR